MVVRTQNRWMQYVIAAASTAIVVAVRLILDDSGLITSAPYLLFAIAIVAAAFVGGWGPGLTATILSWLAADYLFVRPRYRFHFYNDYHELLPQILFLIQGVIICWMGATRIHALRHVLHAATELEKRVDERTAQLKNAYQQIQHESAERLVALDQLEHESVELQQAYARLEGLNRKLDVSNRELQDFASVASHDLQEPLRKIVAFGDRLKTRAGDSLAAEPRDYLDRMQNAAGRMQTLINDLLTFSRVTSRAQPFVPTDLNRLVADVLSDLETRIEEQHAQVQIEPLPTLDADPLQMRQLFQNLLGNALKFNRPDQPPGVRVWAEVRPEGSFGVAPGRGERVTLFVRDNGIGFDEKYLDRIFTVFQRLHGRGVYEGTGIGLAVCRKIVERHGGTITARSQPDQGATFIIDLPRSQATANADEGSESDPALKGQTAHAAQVTTAGE